MKIYDFDLRRDFISYLLVDVLFMIPLSCISWPSLTTYWVEGRSLLCQMIVFLPFSYP